MKILYSNRGRVRIIDDDSALCFRPTWSAPRCEIEGWGAAIGLTAGLGATIGGGVLAAGATVASGALSANAQKQAANTAANSQNQANNQNYEMFEESRGSKGNAIFPQYLNGANGSPFEPQFGTDLTTAYANTAVPQGAFTAAAAKTAPAQAGATQFTNDIFDGSLTNQMLKTQAPVNQARLTVAKSSSMDALSQTLNAIDSAQASRGYVGDSYANRLLSFQANQQAGNNIGQARVENAQSVADTTNYGNVTLPQNNIQLPYTMAQSNAQEVFLPNDQYLQSIAQRAQPLNDLKIGVTGPFQYQPLPTPGPGAYSGTASALGALGGSAGGFGGAALQYYMQQNALNGFGNQSPDQIATAFGGTYNPGGGGAAPAFEFGPSSAYSSGAALAGSNLVGSMTSDAGDWANVSP